MGRIDGIVFDAVGTLIDPAPPVAEAYLAAARAQGVTLGRDEVRARFRAHFRHDEADEIRGPFTTDEPNEERRWRRIVADVLPELPDPVSGFRDLWAHFARPSSWRCFSDVGPTLRSLHEAGLALCVGSNFDARLRTVADGLPDLGPVRERLVISSEVGYRKPHAAFFQAACEFLNLPPERVLCVGDDRENDVLGPRRAGLQGLWLDRDGQGAPDEDAVTDLRGLLLRLGLEPVGRDDSASGRKVP